MEQLEPRAPRGRGGPRRVDPRARVGPHDRRRGHRRRRTRRDPSEPRHAADDPWQGRRRLLRARPRAVAPARARAAPRPRAEPGSRRSPGRVAFGVLLWCALAARARRCALPPRPRRDRPPGARRAVSRSASRSCRRSSSTSSSSTRRCWARSFSPWPSGRSPCGADDLRARPWPLAWLLATLPWLHQKFLPVWLVLTATAVALVWRGRGRGAPAGPGPPRAAGREPVPVRALQLRDHRERPPRRALPRLGTGRRDERARRPGRPRPLARRALRHRAVRAGAGAGRGRARDARRAAARDRGALGRRLLPDGRQRRQLVGCRVQPRPLLHAAGAARGRARGPGARPGDRRERRHRPSRPPRGRSRPRRVERALRRAPLA